MNGGIRRLGILAGGGELPREIADSAARRGVPVAIVAIEGEADADLGSHAVTRVNWGGIGAMVRALKQARVSDLVIVGRVHRPELRGLKPDLGFFRYLPQIVKIVAAGGDDGVLRRVVRFFEGQGVRIIGPGEAAPELLVRAGPMGAARAGTADRADIDTGFALVRALGPYDIGQSVIVAEGRIEAIEGAEGTDRMLARVAERRRAAGEATRRRGVLVKRSKPGQDLRVDMPAIGPATVDGARAAGLAGIAVEAERVLAAERRATLARADAAPMFVEGVADAAAPAAPRRFDARAAAMPLRALGRVAPERHAIGDAVKGLAAAHAAAPFGCGRAAVVVRNHVLAVEAGGEGAAATLARAAGLRQWASLTRRRRGVAALADAADLTRAVLEAVAAAGYAGIALAAGEAGADLIGAADDLGLFVLARAAEAEARP